MKTSSNTTKKKRSRLSRCCLSRQSLRARAKPASSIHQQFIQIPEGFLNFWAVKTCHIRYQPSKKNMLPTKWDLYVIPVI